MEEEREDIEGPKGFQTKKGEHELLNTSSLRYPHCIGLMSQRAESLGKLARA